MIGYCGCGRPVTTTAGTCGRWECWSAIPADPASVLPVLAHLVATGKATDKQRAELAKVLTSPAELLITRNPAPDASPVRTPSGACASFSAGPVASPDSATLAHILTQVLQRDAEFSLSGMPNDCGCMRLSRQAERDYEQGRCPHQIARAILKTMEPAP